MKLSDFDYDLPRELIAQFPSSRREQSRLMIMDRSSGELRETRFVNFPRYLMEGDILVLNETKVIPARIFASKSTGAKVEVFLVRRLGHRRWVAMIKPGRRIRAGEVLSVEKEHGIFVADKAPSGQWEVHLLINMDERDFLEKYGRVPLPPYIKRLDEELDRDRYQTIYARDDGSIAAPTAGLHFTEDVLADIRRRGVTIVPVTLHVGPSTFKPLERETVEENKLEAETLLLRKSYLELLSDARRSGRRIVAVGTTTTRLLEAIVSGRVSNVEEREVGGETYICGETDLFIYPGYEFRSVDALLTNLHLPKSSLLLLVAAFAGTDAVLRAYKWAVERKFHFYSYGDAMFIR